MGLFSPENDCPQNVTIRQATVNKVRVLQISGRLVHRPENKKPAVTIPSLWSGADRRH